MNILEIVRWVSLRLIFLNVPKAVIYVPVGFGLVILLALLRGADAFRKRWIRLGCAVLVGGFLAAIFVPGLLARARANSLLKTANERIAAIRKAPAQIKVVDANGNPVAGATVRVE